MTTTSIVERARKWLKRDVIPIPIPYASKAPTISGWQNLRPTEEELSELFGAPCNIGILLGDVSGGLIDIDLDCDEAVITAALFFPDTPTFGRKSRPNSHLIYICPGIETRKFSCDGMILEIRSTGCQTIAPGSTHPSGEIVEQYRKGEIASIMPEELTRAAERTAAAALLAKQWRANNGSRHEATLALAGALTGACWSDDEIMTFVHGVCKAGNDEEINDRLRAASDTIETAKTNQPTTGWPRLAEYVGDDVVAKARKWLGADQIILKSSGKSLDELSWGELLPLHREIPEPEPYPINALGNVLAPFVNKMREVIQAPDSICASSVLAAATLATQARIDVDIAGRKFPLSLFFVTIGESGERKTAVDAEALAPIRKFQRDRLDVYALEMADYEIEAAAHKKAVEQALSSKSYTTAAEKAAAAKDCGPAPVAPVQPILLSDSPTLEGLHKAFQHGWPSMGLFSDEGGQFLGGYGLKNENALKTAAGLSSLWNGQAISRTRAGDGNILLHGRRLSMHLMIQPILAPLIFGNELLIEQGLPNRCLISHPVSTMGTRLFKDSRVRESIEGQAYFAVIMAMLERPLPLVDGKLNELQPVAIQMESNAQFIWETFHDHIEEMLADDRELYQIRGGASKAAEQCARIAALLQILDDPESPSIQIEQVERAVILTEFYLNEMLRLFDMSGVDTKIVKAEKLLTWLHQKPEKALSLRDIYQRGPRCLRSKQDALSALEILQGHGYARPTGSSKWEWR